MKWISKRDEAIGKDILKKLGREDSSYTDEQKQQWLEYVRILRLALESPPSSSVMKFIADLE